MPISWHHTCYIAVRFEHPLPSLLLAKSAAVGYCLRHTVEQQGALKFLERVEKRLGWRTSWMMRELEDQWLELAAFDSWVT